MKMRI